MSKTRFAVMAAAVLGFVFAWSSAMAAITGSAHDMTIFAAGATGETDQVCKYCHAPHNPVAAVPLWNRATPATTYTPYSNATSMNATVGQPGATSLMCMSCHDGSIATDSYGKGATGRNAARTGTVFMTSASAAFMGSDLSSDHPIGFVYDGTLATNDGWLVTPNSATKVDAAGTAPLFSGRVECASCHAVHDTTFAPFLRKSNAGSAVCKTCHTK